MKNFKFFSDVVCWGGLNLDWKPDILCVLEIKDKNKVIDIVVKDKMGFVGNIYIEKNLTTKNPPISQGI